MKKRMLIYLFILGASLVACGKREAPIYADADSLARSIYAEAGFETDAIYAENLEPRDAYVFGLVPTDFENGVETAVCYRKTVDSNGQLLYVLKLCEGMDGEALAAKFFAHYDFVPCDLAEKMAIAATEEYLIFFKSDSGEVDAAVEAFRTLMNGYIGFEREMVNRA